MFSGEGTLPLPHSHNWKYRIALPKPPKGQGLGRDTSVTILSHSCIVNGSHFGKRLPSFLGNEASIPAVRTWRQEGGLPGQLELHSKTLSQNKNKNLQPTKDRGVMGSTKETTSQTQQN